MEQAPLNVLIIGGGVAGPVLALALQKTTKHHIILVDTNPEETQPKGAGIGISPNGMKALHFINAEKVVTDHGAQLQYMSWGKGHPGILTAQYDLDEGWVKKFGFPGYAIKREELVRELHRTVKDRKIEMRFNLRLQRIEEIEENKVVAHFKDGETITADLIVGCDGIHSVTRQYVTGDASDPNFSGTSIILGLATLTPEEEKEQLNGMTMWIGSGSFFGCVRLDNNGGWGFFHGFPSKDPAGGEAGWDKADNTTEHFVSLSRSKIPHWEAKLPHLLLQKAYRAFPLGLYDRQPIERWHKGRVVLCGDAAHPTTPMGAQGGQMAMESAVILARLLGENEPSDELFERFARLRRPRTDKVTINARRGLKNATVGGAWGAVRDFAMWLIGGYVIQSGMFGHFNYDAGTASLT